MAVKKYLFSQGLREVRFLFCQNSEQSAAFRRFIVKTYPTMKSSNPDVPILIREAAGTRAKVFARFEQGAEKSESLEGLSDEQVESTVAYLVK